MQMRIIFGGGISYPRFNDSRVKSHIDVNKLSLIGVSVHVAPIWRC